MTDGGAGMETRISARLEISAAHRLHRHRGKCFNVHGHNYLIEVEVEGTRPEMTAWSWTSPS